jgi:uncharacterized integral membrane protein
MNFYWIYDFPNWEVGLLIVGVCVVCSLVGLFATRPLMRSLLGASDRYNELVSWVFAGICVFYGLAVGLIAVATWENYSEVDSEITTEAALIASLYNDLDGYQQPLRATLEEELRAYTRLILDQDWPAHRKGEESAVGTSLLDRFENRVMAFSPSEEREKIIHAAVIKSLDDVVEARRRRLSSVTTGLPLALWVVVLVGAVINTTMVYLFWVENVRLHAILVGLFAAFIGLLLFLTAVMDNPFRGQFSVSPENFQGVLDHVMAPTLASPSGKPGL